jgi:hypothetical protein
MPLLNLKTRCWLPVAAACAVLAAMSLSATARAATPGDSANDKPAAAGAAAPSHPILNRLRPAYHLAERSEAAQKAAAAPALSPAQANEHPLMPVLRWAYSGMGDMQKLHDYSATVAKRERIGGKLLEYQYMFVKLRQKPFSVYMLFLGPAEMKGREVIYVEGQNNGNLWAHGTGVERTVGTLSLKPDGFVAMKNQRYPLTELGILNMTRRLVEVGEDNKRFGECDVKFYEGAKINGRVCTCIEVVHPVPRRNFLFHLARIFVDKDLNLPIRYESYDWPRERGAAVSAEELMEEYTYVNLKLNVGYTDADFDIKNPNYKFP